ncbi:hypothetical protein [Pseudomonas chlororaphis]|uniref:hypothetical protein n=1 Tax=Pseudomonas chlororaphis TaxID=587753 RepID=UPI000F589E8B|nr:hypothetical protein [Pseudomonas chlororaphis]
MVTRLRWAAEKLFTGGDLSLAFLLWAYPFQVRRSAALLKPVSGNSKALSPSSAISASGMKKMSCGRLRVAFFGRGKRLAPALQVIAGKPRSYRSQQSEFIPRKCLHDP